METTEKLRVRLDQILSQPSPDGPYLSVELTRGPRVDNPPTTAMVREWTGKEQQLMASEGLNPSQRIEKMVAACTKAIGTVEDRETINRWVHGLTVTDRTLLLFAIRRATLSPLYPYITKCPNPSCRVEELNEVNLGEFEVIHPTDLSWSREVTLPSGLEVAVHPMTGVEEGIIGKFDAQHAAPLGIVGRLSRLGDFPVSLREGATFRELRPLLDRVLAWPGGDVDAFGQVVRELEGGVDTTATTECGSCGREYTEEVQLGEGFFAPLALRGRWKKKSSG